MRIPEQSEPLWGYVFAVRDVESGTQIARIYYPLLLAQRKMKQKGSPNRYRRIGVDFYD